MELPLTLRRRRPCKLNQGLPVESDWMINVAINAASEAAPQTKKCNLRASRVSTDGYLNP